MKLLKPKSLNAEEELSIKKFGKYVAFLRRHPTHATRVLFGIVIPPHEATLLETCWMGFRNNVIKCSRGTSKTFTIGSLFAPLKALLTRNCNILVASASRFRGGKLVLTDTERLVLGQLSGQKLKGSWVRNSIGHIKAIKHDPDMWSIPFKSNSSVFTVPTNNEESIRGLRANVMVLDERNTFDEDAIKIVFKPFIIVGTDFDSPAKGAESNQIFSVGTIDYSYRGWHKEILEVKDTIKLQYLANRAMMEQDWSTYHDLMEKHGTKITNTSISFMRFDYTDLLIPTEIGKYKVHYPAIDKTKYIKFDQRDNQEYYFTYPVNKRELESDLDEGLVDKESWEAEHRNMFIRASGSVYSPNLVEKATGPIFTIKEEQDRNWNLEVRGSRYLPPVLYECSDPCVLGLDTARTSDFTAFVIIRIGTMSEEFFIEKKNKYSLTSSSGPSDWANVIWAEQHQHLTTKETASILYELRKRYNIIHTRSVCGIAMDARGGGVHVRDELANPSPPVDEITGRPIINWTIPQRIFDPEDKEFKQLLGSENTWPGLKLLQVTDIMNQELVSFSRAQMESGKLFVGAYKSQNERTEKEKKCGVGFLGVRTLKHQLLRIQAAPTASGKSVRFEMPGDSRKIENKKDMFSAFLYSCYALREAQRELLKNKRSIPVSYGAVIRL